MNEANDGFAPLSFRIPHSTCSGVSPDSPYTTFATGRPDGTPICNSAPTADECVGHVDGHQQKGGAAILSEPRWKEGGPGFGPGSPTRYGPRSASCSGSLSAILS